MDEVERLREGWDTCVQVNRVLNRELAEAEEIIRMLLKRDSSAEDKADAFLNRRW